MKNPWIFVASVLGLTGCCAGIIRADLGNIEGTPVHGLETDGAKILYYASLAPSSHNIQPWQVQPLGPWHWRISPDPARSIPAVDPTNREVMISLGAFVENLSSAAGALGYKADCLLMEAPRLDIQLEPAPPSSFPLQQIAARRTVRDGLRNQTLKDEDLNLLKVAFDGHVSYFGSGSEEAKYLREGTLAAFRAQSYRDEAQKELAQWVRFSDQEARQHQDGLTQESMGITGFAGWYVRHFMGKADVLKEDFRKSGIDKTAQQVKQGGGWMIITSPSENAADLIQSGRVIERSWLLARERKVGFHPMNQMLEEQPWKDEITGKLGLKEIPVFVLRLGYLDSYPAPVSLRRPPSQFVLTNQ